MGKALLENGIKNGAILDDMPLRDVFACYAHQQEFSMLEKNDPATFGRCLKSLQKSIKNVAQCAVDNMQYAAADAAASGTGSRLCILSRTDPERSWRTALAQF